MASEITLSDGEFIVSKTDTKGRIIYGNKYFLSISGYEERELIGAPHNILRHPDMPKVIFKLLWDAIKSKKEIFAYVQNRCKDGSHYWVLANVTVTIDSSGNIRDFHSVRRKPSNKAMDVIPALYRELKNAESRGGVDASMKLLNQTLQKEGTDYETYILDLQH